MKTRTCLATLGLVLLLGGALPVSAIHFDFDTTDGNASILIRDIYLTGCHFGDGDEVGVLTPGGVCAGGWPIPVPWREIGMPAWGADTLNGGEVNGFFDDEPFAFMYWDASEETEVHLPVIMLISGGSDWRFNGITVLNLAEEGLIFEPTPTSIRHRLTCNSVRVITDDVIQTPEDLTQFGILTPEGVVAGILIWDAENETMAGWAFGDNPNTEVVEGFAEGEDFNFRYWHPESERMIDASVTIVSGGETFNIDGETEVALQIIISGVGSEAAVPAKFQVKGFYPNPFNAQSWLTVEVNKPGLLALNLTDLTGRTCSTLTRELTTAGEQRIAFTPVGIAAGLYFCHIRFEGRTELVRVVYLK
ncbi:MAG: T9SS type A sorting domain-containing protein [Calditrichota bacterium]